MREELAAELEAAVNAEMGPHQPDLAWVMQRGGRVRRVRRALMSAGVVAVLAVGGVGIQALEGDSEPIQPPVAAPRSTPDVQEPLPGEVVEEIPDRFQAEIFANRALAATGLIDPHGARSYNWTTEAETTETDDGWRVGFAASDCEPKGNVFTCTGLSGEDPNDGNALTDTWVTVRLEEGRWYVVTVEGNMLEEEKDRVLGYSLPQRAEPSHWDMTATGMWNGRAETSAIMPMWVGPFPTTAPGSICEMQFVNEAGVPVGQPSSFYQEAPAQEFRRGGGIRGGGVGSEPPSDASDLHVTCRQYTGRGWELASEVEKVTVGRDVVGLSAELAWHGEEGFTTAAVCQATLLDEDQEVAFEGSGRVEPLWRSNELKDYPYRATVYVDFGGKRFFGVENYYVDRFECVSR